MSKKIKEEKAEKVKKIEKKPSFDIARYKEMAAGFGIHKIQAARILQEEGLEKGPMINEAELLKLYKKYYGGK